MGYASFICTDRVMRLETVSRPMREVVRVPVMETMRMSTTAGAGAFSTTTLGAGCGCASTCVSPR